MTADKHAIYSAWAPPESPWSPWVKPAVFAHIPAELEIVRPFVAIADASGYPPADSRCALVLDLAGAESVTVGLALAALGYRPVPLFNSCPPSPDDTVRMTVAAVDARAILEALVAGAPKMVSVRLPGNAPPAFLLDSRRQAPGMVITPRMFDNRSVVFAADFPSANFLREQGITGAHLVHDPQAPVEDDLRYALRHWPLGGVKVEGLSPTGEPFPMDWPRGGILGELAERFRAFFTFRRNSQGGFGRFVPEASGG